MNDKTPHKRELFPHYIGINKQEEQELLQELELKSLDDLFSHIDPQVLHKGLKMNTSLSHPQLKEHILEMAKKNKIYTSFIGDGLQDFKVPDIVAKVCSIRGLTTAYTPYQPERSQGTLQSLWIYQNLISKLTGFEAINASLYERATCLFEALNCATRIKKNKNTVLVAENIYPQDLEVLKTQAKWTKLKLIFVPINKESGLIDQQELKNLIKKNHDIAAFAFTQISSFGHIEEFDTLTDICQKNELLSISLVNLHALSNNGLKEPAKWGSNASGTDILVAEGQSLTLEPNFGGPGLGIFGIRFNQDNKNMIRAAAGRFIGKTKDINGTECKAIILSTREQHIRREKATSNICSNQSFVATACGAAILNKGSDGFNESFQLAHKNALKLLQELTCFEGVELAFNAPIFNEFTLRLKTNVAELINLAANEEQIHIGVDISHRCHLNDNLLHISVNDQHSSLDLQKIVTFFKSQFKPKSISSTISSIRNNQKRIQEFHFEAKATQELYDYYGQLGKQNLSPDDGIYPLGSCTMKYNPEINEWAANLKEFTKTHPQAPETSVQGNLEILYNIQEIFKDITGLPGVTTQPVAGAQGELVGLKMFQAYHADKGEQQSRDIILIPRSAHGTNPATATMAGFETKKLNGIAYGIQIINANDNGEIDFNQLQSLVETYKERIAGVMITNPNTAGIFETKFKEISQLIHSVGGLVYMDGANMNAIAGKVDLNALGVDAVHNNLHKTWSIPHGGGGPGDAIVAVSQLLIDYLPGRQVKKNEHGSYSTYKAKKSIGEFHRHYGNFAHKVRAYTYLKALGSDGIARMSGIAVLSARYLYQKLKKTYPVLPAHSENSPRMHEFILTLHEDSFNRLAKAGTPKAQVMAKLGKLFLDFGFHAPTVAFPEVYGLMLEPTESFTKSELDRFCQVVETIHHIINEYPQVLQTVPHFTPVAKVDEVLANKHPILTEDIKNLLSPVLKDKEAAEVLRNSRPEKIIEKILQAHESALA
ncbi:MAG: aminomethyl-transferring glycine dehydrogenase subunit GcvPB [Bacteriovoracaceae bacterium]|jgi:glycine dehydrogenase|nr:glycine dehydrogenase [Halobacteriovoraceae bacterium]MDP7320018.1 aminomethyl-transferring glycine dehydrogenase subunit GcvPB [Bacteriovoracaceae bacterium]